MRTAVSAEAWTAGPAARDRGVQPDTVVPWTPEELARDLPLEWRGMHRFLPALMAMRGARIEEIPVHHRPRAGGRSKYTNWGRLKETIWDLWAVRWMQKRHRRFSAEEQV